jgi:hypothetical protein
MIFRILNSGLGRLVATIVGIAIIYSVINLIFVGGQNLWHSGDKKKMEELKTLMDSENNVIRDYEDLNKSGRITTKQYNTYKETIDLYNAQVKQYNELAKSVGTTYYVVPIPGRSH